MAEYTLYGFNASTYVRTVRMLLIEKGIAYEQVPVNILAGEARSESHLRRHPFGKIPALEAGEVCLYETDAITELIEGQHPESPRFIPEDPVERARMRQWMGTVDDYTYPAVVGTIVWQRIVNPALGEATDEQVCREALPDARYHLGLFDQALARDAYLGAQAPTLADLYLAPIMGYLDQTPEGDQLLGEFPNLGRWWSAIQARESFQRTPPS